MKQDHRRVAAKQKWEPEYVAKKFGVSVEKVKEAIEAVGHGRNKVYAWLRSDSAAVQDGSTDEGFSIE